MKILFDATVFQLPFTGVAKSTLFLYRECLKTSATLEFVGVHSRKLFKPLPEGISTEVIGRYVPERYWMSTAMLKAARELKPDVVHFPWNGNIPDGARGAVIATTIHDVLPLEIPNFFGGNAQSREQYCTRLQKDIHRSNVLFTTSQYSKQEITKNFDVDKEITLIYHGPTLDSPKETGTNFPAGNFFIYLGGYGGRKGLPKLLETYLKLYKAQKIRSSLLIVGKPSFISSKFSAMLTEGKKLGVVEERGYVDDEELASLLINARALIYPSRYEGFGLPPLEAMNLGCPVVTTRGTALPEICGEAVYYIDPDSDEDFYRAYMDLEFNSSLREELIQKGRKQASTFSWSKTANIFLHTLENELKG